MPPTRNANEKLEWKKNPTPENHHVIHTPCVDWSRLSSYEQWEWPYRHLGYSDPEAIWSTLYTKYNCIPFAIQDPYMWHADICELARASNNQDEFESALQKRRDERFQEVRSNWEKTRSQLTAHPIIWKGLPRGPDRPWATFVRVGRHFSFDTMVGYFGNFVVDDPQALYREEREARRAQAAAEKLATSATGQARAASSTHPEQPPQAPQPTLNSTPAPPSPSSSPSATSSPRRHPASPPPPPPPPAATANTKTRHKRAFGECVRPAARSRVEKPPPKRTNKSRPKSSPREGVRRSARLQERAAHAGR
ncbi:hypothetical protein F5Y01DRAFT_299499 [Xylaria sp. FL0043]|nr:hypothetical protein F5Y01DRAFT_299499 [Xylaria sp. FL0043]